MRWTFFSDTNIWREQLVHRYLQNNICFALVAKCVFINTFLTTSLSVRQELWGFSRSASTWGFVHLWAWTTSGITTTLISRKSFEINREETSWNLSTKTVFIAMGTFVYAYFFPFLAEFQVNLIYWDMIPDMSSAIR